MKPKPKPNRHCPPEFSFDNQKRYDYRRVEEFHGKHGEVGCCGEDIGTGDCALCAAYHVGYENGYKSGQGSMINTTRLPMRWPK